MFGHERNMHLTSIVRQFAAAYPRRPRNARHAIFETQAHLVMLHHIKLTDLYEFIRLAGEDEAFGFRCLPLGTLGSHDRHGSHLSQDKDGWREDKDAGRQDTHATGCLVWDPKAALRCTKLRLLSGGVGKTSTGSRAASGGACPTAGGGDTEQFHYWSPEQFHYWSPAPLESRYDVWDYGLVLDLDAQEGAQEVVDVTGGAWPFEGPKVEGPKVEGSKVEGSMVEGSMVEGSTMVGDPRPLQGRLFDAGAVDHECTDRKDPEATAERAIHAWVLAWPSDDTRYEGASSHQAPDQQGFNAPYVGGSKELFQRGSKDVPHGGSKNVSHGSPKDVSHRAFKEVFQGGSKDSPHGGSPRKGGSKGKAATPFRRWKEQNQDSFVSSLCMALKETERKWLWHRCVGYLVPNRCVGYLVPNVASKVPHATAPHATPAHGGSKPSRDLAGKASVASSTSSMAVHVMPTCAQVEQLMERLLHSQSLLPLHMIDARLEAITSLDAPWLLLLEDLAVRHAAHARVSACGTWLFLLPPPSVHGSRGGVTHANMAIVIKVNERKVESRDGLSAAWAVESGMRHVFMWVCCCEEGPLDVMVLDCAEVRQWIRTIATDVCHWLWGLSF